MINSLQRSTYLERIDVKGFAPYNVISYDVDNLYPQKCITIAQRSGSLSTALRTYAKFIKGAGFDGDDQSVGKISAYDLVHFVAKEKAFFGYAIHLNYNGVGQISEMTPVPFEFVRISKKEGAGFIISNNWDDLYGVKTETLKVHAYNPDSVLQEIEEAGGLDDYNGQLFYWKPSTDIYPLATFDSVLDDSQFEAEAKLYSLSSIQHDFAISGILKYPKNLQGTEEFKQIEDALSKGKGSANAGKILTMGVNPDQAFTNNQFFEPLSRNDIDTLFEMQLENAKNNIYELYQQPGILNGRAETGMFNDQSMLDAFKYYNSVTQEDRNDIEKGLNTLLENSIFSVRVEIKPLEWNPTETTETLTETTEL